MDVGYMLNLKATNRYFSLSNGAAFALADCDPTGQLSSHYCLLEKCIFSSSSNSNVKTVLLACSCPQASEQRARLNMMSGEISEDITHFTKREEATYCLHAKAALKLSSEEFNIHSAHVDDINEFVDILSTTPLLAIACSDGSYGLISKRKHTGTHSFHCAHLTTFQQWYEENGLTEDTAPAALDEEVVHASQSFLRVPYPLPLSLKALYDELESGNQKFPTHLVPHLDGSVCKHGNK